MIDYPSLSDTQLLHLLATGNQAAFREIYNRYANSLYRFARKTIPTHEDCEELIQDLFVSLWKRHDQLRLESLRAYLFRSIRYMIIRYLHNRGIKRRYVEHYKAFEKSWEDFAFPEEPNENLIQRLLHLLAALPERNREAFTLRLTENLSNQEIAERMHITKRTVEVYMTKAFAHLRQHKNEVLGKVEI